MLAHSIKNAAKEEWIMFTVTETAKAEIKNRLHAAGTKPFIRLQMRHSCFMKLKLTLEESLCSNDTEMTIDGLHFIIDKNHCHYFHDKKIDFIPDHTGFKQFEAI
jgi:Fe-S cluster assembly iron-binding protein IscA